MKLSWRVPTTVDIACSGHWLFFWQGAFASAPADMSKNTASTRMTYGRFLNT